MFGWARFGRPVVKSVELRIASSRPATFIRFYNRTDDTMDVAVSTPSLEATKRISLYTYGASDGFGAFFATLAAQKTPWSEPILWEPLERDMSLEARCDPVGHVEFRLTLREGRNADDMWELTARLEVELGMLPSVAAAAETFSKAGRE